MWNVTWLNYRSVYGAYDDIINSIQLLIEGLGLPGAEFFDWTKLYNNLDHLTFKTTGK